ncbi:MAG: TIGR03790 family protein [Planctomycetes bacterium]|nr:TIGR03790 family protein [Planctomycetota bacterium]
MDGLFLAVLFSAGPALAGDVPFQVDVTRQVMVVVNDRVPESVEIGRHYASRRGIPESMIVSVSTSEKEEISREVFDREILAPVRAFYEAHREVLFLVTTWGVPVKIAETDGSDDKGVGEGFIGGRDFAAVDQELALLPRGTWETKGLVENPYYGRDEPISAGVKRLVFGRLDGPSAQVAKGLVNLALLGERFGLSGKAYIDTRGLTNPDGYKARDDEMKGTLKVLERHGFPFHHDDKPEVLDLSEFDDVVLYDGWYTGTYNFKKPEFRFPPGAVAVHLHSFAAGVVRTDKECWVGPLLAHGATATCGTVYEPLTLGFPISVIAYDRLLSGYTLGESFAMADRCLSWQAIVLGDPLYAPFAAGGKEEQARNRRQLESLETERAAAEAAGRLAEAWRKANELAELALDLPAGTRADEARAAIELRAREELDRLAASFRRDGTPQALAAVEGFARAWEGTSFGEEASRLAAGARARADAEAQSVWVRAQECEKKGELLEARGKYETLVKRHSLSRFAGQAAERLAAIDSDPQAQARVAAARRIEDARRLFTLGTNSRANGNEAKAREYFQKVVDEYGDTEYAKKAREALAKGR